MRLSVLPSNVRNAIEVADRPVFVGDAEIDYVCGACGRPLCLGMHDGDLAGLVLLCRCGRSNRVRYPYPAEPLALAAAG